MSEPALDVSPVPPPLPPGRTIHLPGRGALVVRELDGPAGAPVLFLLHGWTVTADLNWYRVFEALGEQYRVIAFDHRGHGRGIRSRGHFRLRDCADDVVAVADALGIDRFTPVGYSMGGSVATLVWLHHRSRVESLVLCASACRFADSFAVRAQLGMFRPASWLMRSLPHTAARPLFDKAINFRTRGRGLHDWVIDEVASGDPRLVVQAGVELRRFDSRGLVPAIGVPISVVVIDHDTILPTRLQEELVTLLMHPSVFHIDGDHDVCVRDGERFVKTLLEACKAAVPR